MKKRWISGWAVLALGGAAAMATPDYTAVFLPTDGLTRTYARGIASNGQIVGYANDAGIALLWNSPYSAPTLLNTASYKTTEAYATDGTYQGGEAATGTSGDPILWNGSAQSGIDLNPSGYTDTQIDGIANGQEVGAGSQPGQPEHALLWNGTDSNAVDLNPANYLLSFVNGTNGTYQVGAGRPNSVNGVAQDSHALIWSGTAASAVDITPAGDGEAAALAISGDLVAGEGETPGEEDALLWNLSSGSYTDLGPGEAFAVSGNYEAGYAGNDAMVWAGSAASAVNLQSVLPEGYAYSVAYGVDAEGDVVGAAGSYGQWQAVIWLVPEPTIVAIAPIFVLVVRCRRSGR